MKLNSTLLKSTVVAALGGLLFGFDTAVIAGATQALKVLYQLSPLGEGFTVASALVGTVIGSMLAGIPGDRYGRRDSLRGMAVLYVVSALGCAFAWNWTALVIFRFIGGLAIGGSSVLGPMYIAEISPAKWRGRLVGLFQFNVVFGILLAYFSNYVLGTMGFGAAEWRWKLGVTAVPAAFFFLMLFGIPRSPRWLVKKGRIDEAREVLRLIGEENYEQELKDIVESIDAEHVTSDALFTAKYRVPIFLAISIGMFNQLSGINAILYFAPRIFELTGLGAKAALLQSVGIGLTNLVFTFAGLWLIDRLGRRTLLYIGSFGYISSLGLTAWAFFTHHFSIVPACIFAFIAAHAIGQGAVIWVFISEIFPNRHRAEGQALGSFTHWIFAALLTTFFPRMVSSFPPGYVFAFFAGMMVLQLIWVKAMVPETKNVPLEQIQKQLGIE